MTWQEQLQNSLRTIEDLSQVIPLSEEDRAHMEEILNCSPMLVTPYYLSLIDLSDESDPIRKIALPSLTEADLSGSYDTSGEGDNTVVTGMQHKYAETALMLSTSLCAMYCRHCFRKRLVGLHDKDSVQDMEEVRAYLLAHPEIKNVLVSGGDALMNSNERLAEILDVLVDIDHLDFIRLATRIPVSLPQRITEDAELLALLDSYNQRKQLFMVTQFDHVNEITPESTAAVKAVLDLGIPVRNQTVLLKGVNDDPKVLGELLSALPAIGAEPYYVFQCRPVSGVKSGFQVPLRRGVEIVEEARGMQSGISKAFRYCMSHVSGKIEILGNLENGEMMFKYHEAKDRSQLGKLFTRSIAEDQAWLD